MKSSLIHRFINLSKLSESRILHFILFLFLIVLTLQLSAQSNKLTSVFDDYVEKTLQEWNATGVIIVVVKDGKLDFVKGYGTRQFGKDLLPNDETLFHIASHSKSITAAAIGILIEEGKLSWGDPVYKYIQEFQFVDDYVSQNTTIRDILSHRTGLPHSVGSMIDPNYSFSDLILDLKDTKPVINFREGHSYSNIGYVLAGEIITRVSGLSYTDFVVQRIFEPLGMTQSFTGITQLKGSTGDPNDIRNIFFPARQEEGGAYSTNWGKGFNTLYDPAGGIITTADDISKWLIMQLQEGEYNGKQFLNVETIREMHKSQIVVEPLVINTMVYDWVKLHNPHLQFITYGLGWFLYDYNGLKVSEHTGLGTNRCSISIIPEVNLCIAACTNTMTSTPDGFRDMRIVSALKLKIIDFYTDVPERDWSSIFLKIHEDEVARIQNR